MKYHFENPFPRFNLNLENLNPNNPENLLNIFLLITFITFFVFSYIYSKLKPENKESIKKISKYIITSFLMITGFFLFLKTSESIFRNTERSFLFTCLSFLIVFLLIKLIEESKKLKFKKDE